MRLFLLILLTGVPLGLLAQLFPQLGAQRAGISSLTFLKMDVSPRSAALASANLCLPGDLYSAYTNPATMPEVSGFGLAASNTFWVADINYAFLSATIPTGAGHFAASLSALGSGPMKVRTVFQPEGTGEYFYANYYTAGLTYSQQLTDQFSYGITAKYVHEQLAEFRANTAVFDLGFLYRTDVKELRFAVLVQSFGFNSVLHGELEQEDALLQKTPDLESYPAPTIFKLGISMVPYRNESGDQSLLAAVQLNHPNDNAENIRLALEYNYKSLLFLRAGYKINVKDQDYPTAGVGLRMRMGRHPLMFDYAFDPMRFLGVVHRVGLSFEVNSKER